MIFSSEWIITWVLQCVTLSLNSLVYETDHRYSPVYNFEGLFYY